MFGKDLLPHNATLFEKALSLSIDSLERLGFGIEEINDVMFKRPIGHNYLNAVLYERGLDLLGSVVQEPELLLDHGTNFYRIRGTKQAVLNVADLIGYDGNLIEASPTRRRWNTFQFGLYRPADTPDDLPRIEKAMQLAVPERSKFVRGWSGYNIPAAVTGRRKTSRSLTGTDSGVSVRPDGPRWSFGQTHDFTYQMRQSNLASMNIFIEPSASPFTWDAVPFKWSYLMFPWGSTVNAVRKSLMAKALSEMSCWFEIAGVDTKSETVETFRKAKIMLVDPDPNGKIECDGQKYSLGGAGSETLYVEALTDFGECAGSGFNSAYQSMLFFNVSVIDSAKPGLLSAQGSELNIPFPPSAINYTKFKIDQTSRHRMRTILRIVD